MKLNWARLIGCIIGVELIGNIGSFATFNQITTWYAALNKPSFNPPNFLFGPVWTILFALMGIALYLVWSHSGDKKEVKSALALFAIQLMLNVLWSFVFFGWHQPGWAFVEIILMWLAIFATIVSFSKISKTAAWLMVPYLAWVSFATCLTYAVWRLN
jgi:tryptophan-rich sensory protein